MFLFLSSGFTGAHNILARMIYSKIDTGFARFEANTGSVHPNFRNVSAPPHRLHKRQSANATGSGVGTDSLTDDDDNQLWQGTISVGTPPVTYTVDFDTGSADLFLPSPECVSDTCSGHKPYDTSSSSTSEDLGQTFSLGFGDG